MIEKLLTPEERSHLVQLAQSQVRKIIPRPVSATEAMSSTFRVDEVLLAGILLALLERSDSHD